MTEHLQLDGKVCSSQEHSARSSQEPQSDSYNFYAPS